MKMNSKYIIPSLVAIGLTASVAIAQIPGPRGNRTPPTTEQMAARQTQMCADRQARGDAAFTYMEERLKLTAAQKPLFERWKAAMQSENAARQADCAKPRPAQGANAQRPTLPERNARMEEMLKTRLATLEKMRGPEEALYNALTADQKPLFEQRGGRGGRMGMRGRGFGGGGFGGGRSAGRGFGGGGFGGGRGPGGPGGGPGGPGPRGGR